MHEGRGVMGGPVRIALSQAGALVLFELLSRELDRPHYGVFAGLITNEAEIWALDGLLGALQRVLSAPFSDDYAAQLTRAAAALIERRGTLPQDDG